jgi:hypothetical protein
MKNDFSKIAPTAFFQAYYRTLYDIPYAKEIAEEIHAKEKYIAFHAADVQSRARLAPVFEARYKGTNEAINNYLEKTNTHQVIELASGLSPQGMIYTEKYPNLKYVETDLEDMIKIKRSLIAKVSLSKNDRLSLKVANSLNSEELEKAIASLDAGPVLIFNIGFISYLDMKEKVVLCKNIHSMLARHGGAWITPDPAMHKEGRKKMFADTVSKNRLDGSIAQTTGRNYDDNAFADEATTDDFYRLQGFNIEKYFPKNGYSLVSPKNAGLSETDAKTMLDYVNKYAKVWIFTVRKI